MVHVSAAAAWREADGGVSPALSVTLALSIPEKVILNLSQSPPVFMLPPGLYKCRAVIELVEIFLWEES